MRIIGGEFRGFRLADPGKGDRAAQLRPTSDRVREAIFNLLLGGVYGDPLTGARVLDLFAGTGALGLEALSRGAQHCTFIDDGATARALLRSNIAAMQLTGRTRVWRRDATRLGRNHGPAFDLVFLDPPYGRDLGARALAAAMEGGWLAPGAMVVWEEAAPQAAPDGFIACDKRRYGDTVVSLLRVAPSD